MTTASDETASPSTRTGGHGLGALLCGIFGTISAGVGLLCLGMSGLVWSGGRFWGSSSWDDEADFGIAAGVFFFVIWAALLLVSDVVTFANNSPASNRGICITSADARTTAPSSFPLILSSSGRDR